MMISDEAVEAAAKAFIEHGTLLEALEAAAPHMLAEAWDEGAESVEWCEIAIPCGDCDQCRKPEPTNPYRSQP